MQSVATTIMRQQFTSLYFFLALSYTRLVYHAAASYQTIRNVHSGLPYGVSLSPICRYAIRRYSILLIFRILGGNLARHTL